MNFTIEEIEDLLEIFYKDARREYLDSIKDPSELIEMFQSNGLLDSEEDDHD